MAFTVKKRGKLTYYAQGERPVLSSLVTEELPDGDLKISFAGLTGGYSAKNILGLDELVTMDPAREIPLVFACWERWLQEAGICESLRDVDFIEIHAFGCQPKSPNPLVDPTGFAREQERLRKAYAEAYAGYFATHLPDNGVPARFTVHVVDVPDTAASYEFYGTALLQRSLQRYEYKTAPSEMPEQAPRRLRGSYGESMPRRKPLEGHGMPCPYTPTTPTTP